MAAAVAGAIAGGFLGAAVEGPSWVSIAGAGVALSGVVAVVVVVQREARREARAHDEAVHARADRERIDLHAERLNDLAFRPLRTVTLAPLSLASGPSSKTGVGLVIQANGAERPVEEIPGWPSAEQHLATEPALADAWARATVAARSCLALRRELVSELRARFDATVLEEFGFDARLGGPTPDSTFWCDTDLLARLSIARGGALDPKELTVLSPLDAAPGPSGFRDSQWVAAGGARLLESRSSDEADPRRLAEVFRRVATETGSRRRAAELRAAEATASRECAQLAERVRGFSDQLLIERSFHGACDACRSWAPR